jgi:hypothetical protein
MIIYQRSVTLQGPVQDVLPWAMEITQRVNDTTKLEVSLWQGMFGMPLGTVVWSSLVDGLAAVEEAHTTLGQATDFLDLQGKAADWIQLPGEDRLLRSIHVTGGEYARADVGAYAEGTLAVPAAGRLAEAAKWGVEISNLHTEVTGQPVIFGSNAFSAYGELGWLAISADAAGIDRAAEAIAADERYAKSLDTAGPLFAEGNSRRTLARRIA